MKHIDGTGLSSVGTRGRTGCVAVCSALLLAAWMVPSLAQDADKDLRLFFRQNCVRCHGSDGSAVSPEGKKLSGQDLTNLKWQQGTRDDEMVKVIQKGKFFGWAMPAFKDTLTRDEAQKMVTDVIRKCKKGTAVGSESK